MHLVQKMSASKKAEFLEALKDLKGGGMAGLVVDTPFLHHLWIVRQKAMAMF